MSNQISAIKNKVLSSNNINDLQLIVDFCKNPSNKDLLFVDFKPYDIPMWHGLHDGKTHFGERNVLDFYATTMILDRLEDLKIPNGKIPLTKINTFLKNNQNFFMSICPKQFIGHPLCPDSVLKDFTQGKFSDIKVKDIVLHIMDGEQKQIEISPSQDQSFVSEQGPIVGKILSNIYDRNKQLPQISDINRGEIVTMFSRTFDMKTSSYFENSFSVTESMYSVASKNEMPNNIISIDNIANEISTETLRFIQTNFDKLTKGVIPRNPFSEKTKTIKLLLEQFKESINTECQARDIKVQESLKRNLSPLSAFVQNNQSKNIEVQNLVAGDDVLNGDEQHNINSSVSEGPSLDDI